MFKDHIGKTSYIYEQAQKVAYQLEFGTIFSRWMGTIKMRVPTLAEILT